MKGIVPKTKPNIIAHSKIKFDFNYEISSFYEDHIAQELINQGQKIRTHETKRETIIDLRKKIESKGPIEICNIPELQSRFEEAFNKNNSSELTKVKLPATRCIQFLKEKVEPEETKVQFKPESILKTGTSNLKHGQFNKEDKKISIAEPKETNVIKKINFANDLNVSFGENNTENEESSKCIDELNDKINNRGLFDNIPLNKIKTSIPDNIKLKSGFNDDLDSFLDDQMKPSLPKVNTFSKHKSVMMKPQGFSDSTFGRNDKPKETEVRLELNAPIKIKQECTSTITSSGISPYKIMKMEQSMKRESIAEPKKLLDKPIDKIASITFSGGMSVMEMAKKFDEENAKKKLAEEIEVILERPARKIASPIENKSAFEQIKHIEKAPKVNESIQQNNIFKSSMGAKPTSLFSSRPNEETGQKPSLSAAVFGKSSLDFNKSQQEMQNQNEMKIERKFGSSSQDVSSGFKGVFGESQPSQNTFLANRGNNAEDNDMAEDNDIFGNSESQFSKNSRASGNFGGGSSAFNQTNPNKFGGFGGNSNSSNLSIDVKSNPSFSQRRK